MAEGVPSTSVPVKKHILTVSVEDYFHVGAFEGAVLRKHWDRFESRLERNLVDLLGLLAQNQVRGTFFVLGCIADRQPELVERIADGGHEIASSGFWPRGIRGMLPEELREDLRRSREALEAAGSGPVIGYRSPRNWLKKQDLWVLDVLCEEGYVYDSSLNPIFRRFSDDPRRYEVHRHRHSVREQTIWEFPISTASFLGLRIAISGGNYVRQLPHTILKHAVRRWDRKCSAPLVFYFMPWEIDSGQPQITSLSTFNRIRHYRNLSKTRWVFEEHFAKYRFQSIREYLELPAVERPKERAPLRQTRTEDAIEWEERPLPDAQPVTLAIPFYNEAENISYLYRALLELRRRLGKKYRIHLTLVDDGSKDNTWNELVARFSSMPNTQVLRHPENRGVAAAILTGIKNAPTEVVCSIDCDCSYDPNVLESMIPLLENADMVTASPYHPQGNVYNVPEWRLFLSKTLSILYSRLLNERFFTYTSCCRVYRKSAIEALDLVHDGFLGIAELLIRLKQKGGRVVEYPTTLESRLFGESKMKIARTIRGHLRLLWEVRSGRLSPSTRAQAAPP